MAARSSACLALGSSLRWFRVERGLTQEELGFESGLDRTYVGGVERGERNPSFESLRKLAWALGVKPSKVMARAESLPEWED